MNFVFFEVWALDDEGHEELVGTTSSKTDAMKMAEESLESTEQYIEVWVNEETQDGDVEEVTRLTINDSGSIINV
jgi:hypothetical protein